MPIYFRRETRRSLHARHVQNTTPIQTPRFRRTLSGGPLISHLGREARGLLPDRCGTCGFFGGTSHGLGGLTALLALQKLRWESRICNLARVEDA